MGIDAGADLTSILSSIEMWHWWVVAVALGGIELILPGVLFLWLALAAVIVGFIKLAMPDLSWELQLILFGVLSVISAVIGRQIYKRAPNAYTDHPKLNQRSAQYIGRTLTLLEKISNSTSRALVDDTTWAVRCEHNLPKGAQVKVTAVDGIMLIVEPFVPSEQETENQATEDS